MKAILVVDMPQTCDECHFSWNTDEEWKLSCQLEHDLGTRKGNKPEWCPLMPVPLKRKSVIEWFDPFKSKYLQTHELTEFDKGWNECVEFIEKGGENND